MSSKTITIKVNKIVFDNQKNFIVILAQPYLPNEKITSEAPLKDISSLDPNLLKVTLKYSRSAIKEDYILQVTGTWGKYKTRDQFKGDSFSVIVEPTSEGFYQWLAMDNVKNVGKKTIDILKENFGDSVLDIFEKENYQDLLFAVDISKEKSEKILFFWENRDNFSLIKAELSNLGFKDNQIDIIMDKYQNTDIMKEVKENIWELSNISGFSFKFLDNISKILKISSLHPDRIICGIQYVIAEASRKYGHCFLKQDDLLLETTKILEISEEVILEAINNMIKSEGIILHEDKIYTNKNFYYEKNLIQDIKKILRAKSLFDEQEVEYALLEAERILDLSLDRDGGQFKSAMNSLIYPVSIITGGPGTGKTTTQKIIIKALEILEEEKNYNNDHEELQGNNYRLQISLCAPTGKAAKRLSETTGKNVQTIHRLLGYKNTEEKIDRPEDNESRYSPYTNFRYNKNNKLISDVVIVDEFSMVDLKLAYSLISALKPRCKLIIIGDKNQLPSVGPGKVLYDLIESNRIPTSELTKIHRQHKNSGIAIMANRINNKTSLFLPEDDFDDFILIEKQDGEIVSSLLKYIREEIIEKGIDPLRDIQILCANKKGSDSESPYFKLGTEDLNYILKMVLNPPLDDENTLKIMNSFYTVGDKVMQISNNYDLGVFNGEVGIIAEIKKTKKEESIKVNYGNMFVVYSGADLENNLSHCCSGTIHKSQGSEHPIVILLNPSSASFMMNKNLIYTAITRARNKCIVFGKKSNFILNCKKEDLSKRQTGLVEMLRKNVFQNQMYYKI